MGLNPSQVDELLAYLITEGFLNEERFAKAFAGGKFRIKKWGRQSEILPVRLIVGESTPARDIVSTAPRPPDPVVAMAP